MPRRAPAGCSLLNNPEVSRTIERELRADPAFNALIAEHIGAPELPAPAAALLLEGAEDATEAAVGGELCWMQCLGGAGSRNESSQLCSQVT